MPKVYDVDEALEEARPQIMLRGVLYAIRDYTVADRIEHQQALYREQVALEAKIESDEDESDEEELAHLKSVLAHAIQLALDGISDEVARTITEREFKAVQKAVLHSRTEEVEPLIRDLGVEEREEIVARQEELAGSLEKAGKAEGQPH